jgi:hypothetical protein
MRDRSAGGQKTPLERQSTSPREEVRVERSTPFVNLRTRVGDGVGCRGIVRVDCTASGTRRRRGVVRSVRYARASASTGTLRFSTHKKFLKLALPASL